MPNPLDNKRRFSDRYDNCRRIRKLVIDLRCPVFNPILNNDGDRRASLLKSKNISLVYPGCCPDAVWDDFCNMNEGQQYAVKKLLSAEDYLLILGMPGTGKTSTLAVAIRCLIARGETVLLTAYTHSAVDNLLLKLKEAGLSEKNALRLGSTDSVHTALHSYTLDYHPGLCSVGDLGRRLEHVRLVACTALAAARSVIVSKFSFDWCLMDEAGQMSQPAAIGAIVGSKRFVLVGDDYQLPPLVLSSEARALGMDISLFKRLSEAHPSAVASLTLQYRMNADIQSICNTLIYGHRLRCADIHVANKKLCLPNMNSVFSSCNNSDDDRFAWLRRCICPTQSVTFLDTDDLFVKENRISPLASLIKSAVTQEDSIDYKRASSSVTNEIETKCVALLSKYLILSGLSPQDLGIISPYRRQVEDIKTHMQNHPEMDSKITNKISVCTVDKFQGKDVEALIVSTVRCALDSSVGVFHIL